MDAQLLFLTMLLLKEKISWGRLSAAALFGGACSVFALVSGIRFGILYVLYVLMLDAVMVLICARRMMKHENAFRRLAAGIIYMQGMAFAYGKLKECAGRLAGERMAGVVAAAVAAGAAVFLSVCRSIADRRRIYEVKLVENGEEIDVKALFDTGNLLCDPLSGKPVSVMEDCPKIREWLEKYPQKYRAVPYRSVGNEHGILEGLVVDELAIQKEDGRVVRTGTVVAVYKGKLSKGGDFEMILNHSLI